MIRVLVAVAVLLSGVAVARAQQPTPPIPLYQSAPPRTIEPEPLPPISPEPPTAPALPSAPIMSGLPPGPAAAAAAPASMPTTSPTAERVFCNQTVSVQLATADSVPAPFRPFIGIFSDAAWTPRLCAALVVERITADGTATIVYAFGPMGSKAPGPGGVLHGTGTVRDGELRFQNSDGSQFSFRLLYSDLQGRLTTPQGQTYQAVFERTP